jgi:threonine aldolase
VLLGSKEFIAAALRWRKALGGGMRQVGFLAAAGLYALEHHVARLAEDHENAEYLARGLSSFGLVVEPPQTNIVYVAIPAQIVEELQTYLAQHGILARIEKKTRLVTHLDVSRKKLDFTLGAFGEYLDRASASNQYVPRTATRQT